MQNTTQREFFMAKKKLKRGFTNISVSKSKDPTPEQLQPLINLYGQGEIQQVLDKTNNMLEKFPSSLALYNICGAAHAGLGKFDAAIESYKNALKIKPDFAEAYYNMGIALESKGELDAAIDSYEHVLKINPDFAAAHNNIGIALKDKGELSAAIDSCKKALKIKPDYAEAYSNMGNALKDKGNPSAAIDCYKKALKINSNYSEAHFNLGIFFYENGLYKEAASEFKLSDLSESETYYLRCLYLQGEKSSFYDQLDYLKSKGEINATIGSLSSRSGIKYGIDRPNPFCNDPLKYVLHTELTEECDFKNTFVKVAKNILAADSVEYKNQGHLTNGIQTAGNFFTQEGDFIDNIKGIIYSEIKKYLANFKNSKEGFIEKWPSDYELKGWLVSMNSGGKLSAHMHDVGWITGSVYINIPPKSMGNSGNLVLCTEELKYITDESLEFQKIINVNTGSLCLFPSSLLHYTIPFESTEERIVLAFDVIPK